MTFSELKVGALFRFGGDNVTYTKTGEGACKDVLGGIYISFGFAECILDPRFQVEIKFGDLVIGEIFRFLAGSEMQYIKTGEDEYCVEENHEPLGSSMCCHNSGAKCVSVFKSDPDTGKFDDLEMGTWFQYRNTRFIKIGPSEARRWGSKDRCPFRNNETMKILTFEEVEK